MSAKINELLLKKHKNFAIINIAKYSSNDELLNSTAQILHNGADILEFFAPGADGAKVLELARKLRDLTGVFNALLIIYDRIDVAKLADADGISLDKNSISVKDARKLTEARFLLGYHAKDKSEAIDAKENGADFLITDKAYFLDIKEFQTAEK